jgi:hypothetical protein
LVRETEAAFRAAASDATGFFTPLLLRPLLRRLDDVKDKTEKLEEMINDLRSKRGGGGGGGGSGDNPGGGGGGSGGPPEDDPWWRKFLRLAKELLVEIATTLAEIAAGIVRLVASAVIEVWAAFWRKAGEMLAEMTWGLILRFFGFDPS